MSATRIRYEQRSTLLALETYLTAKGWSGITYTEGYQGESTIANPQVTVTIRTGRVKTLEHGKTEGTNHLYVRSLVINAYMESDNRALSMVDTLIDFLEFMCVDIVDPDGDTLGTLMCENPDAIIGEAIPPILADPKLMRWRGVVSSPVEAFYPNG